MKKIFILALVFPLLFSCNNNEEEVEDSNVEMATVENPSQLTNFYLNLDDSSRLYVLNNDIKYYRPKNEQRVIVDYTILSNKPRGSSYDHDVKINDVYEVLTKGIFPITSATEDSIGNDPIAINGMWISGNYLNVDFIYPGYSKMHFITLASDASKTYTDNKIHLEFRHNANNDYPSFNISGVVCFNLKSLRKSGSSSVDIVIHSNEFDNGASEKTRNFTYKYGEYVALAPEQHISIPATKAKVK